MAGDREEQASQRASDEGLWNSTSGAFPVMSTGVPQLDLVLGGGLPSRSTTLIMGRPGSGKTTIANQIAFHAAQHGQRALILTALSESTNKLIEHLRAFDFFDSRLVGGPVQFLSLQQVLPRGLAETGREALRMARDIGAKLVVLDGFRGMHGVEGSSLAAREFLYEVGTSLGALGCTLLVTTETDPRDPKFYPEMTTADVIIGLHYTIAEITPQRSIEVIKARARAPLPGLHSLSLSSAGAAIYTQFEARVVAELAPQRDPQLHGSAAAEKLDELSGMASPNLGRTDSRATFNLPALDDLLSGGLTHNTCTLLAGSSGTGKTLLALHFAVAGSDAGEPVLFLGLRESTEQILVKADAFDLGERVRAGIADGQLTLLRIPPIQLNPDVVADRILHEVDRLGAKRLIVDSVFEIERALRSSTYPERADDYLAALVEALHARHVTALFTKETDKALTDTLDFSGGPLSVLAENVILTQQVVYERKLYRMLSVLKMRLSSHEVGLRQFHIVAPTGIEVFESVNTDSDMLADAMRSKTAGSAVSPSRRSNISKRSATEMAGDTALAQGGE